MLANDKNPNSPSKPSNTVVDDDDDDWDTTTPVSVSKKFDHKWIEDTKSLPKWQEKKEKIEDLNLFIKSSQRIDHKDLFELTSFLKLMLNEGIAVLNTSAMQVASVMCKAARKGLRLICKSELCPIVLNKMRDKKMALEASKCVIEFVRWTLDMQDLNDEINKNLNDKKSNLIQRIETCNFIDQLIQMSEFKNRKKEFKTFCLEFGNNFIEKYLNDSDPKVKDATSKLITTIMNT